MRLYLLLEAYNCYLNNYSREREAVLILKGLGNEDLQFNMFKNRIFLLKKKKKEIYQAFIYICFNQFSREIYVKFHASVYLIICIDVYIQNYNKHKIIGHTMRYYLVSFICLWFNYLT